MGFLRSHLLKLCLLLRNTPLYVRLHQEFDNVNHSRRGVLTDPVETRVCVSDESSVDSLLETLNGEYTRQTFSRVPPLSEFPPNRAC